MKKCFLFFFVAIIIINIAQAQQIYYSDFEVWQNNYPQGWNGSNTSLEQTSISQSNDAYTGVSSLKISNQYSTTLKYISSTAFFIMPDKIFELSIWTKGKGAVSINLYLGQSEVINIFPKKTLNDSAWTEYKYRFSTYLLNDSASIELSLGFANVLSSNGILIDNVSIKEINNSNTLDINNIAATIFSNGSLFNAPENLNSNNSLLESSAPLFVAPKNSNASTIFQGNLWIGAKDEANNLHLVAETFYGQDFSWGPIADVYNDAYNERYNRVWKISKEEILYHISNYYIGGYVAAQNILDWPANGDTLNGESQRIAPYCDVNSNGYYDPQNGDYPAIRGDQALFFVFNDFRDNHLSSNGEKLGFEFRAMAYAYDNPQDETLNNNIFISYEVVNKSPNIYTDTYFGMFTDIDLGYGMDDYIGYDSTLSLAYGYNGTQNDGPYYTAYSGVPPVQGVMLLSQVASKFIYFQNSSDAILGHPTNADQYYNYLQGKNRTGAPITYGGDGTNQSNPPTNYMYTGFPEQSSGWNEKSLNNIPGDRRGLISYGPFSLLPNEKICFDFAYPWVKDSNATTPEGSLPLLRQRALTIQSFYNSQNIDCGYNDVSIKDIQTNNSNKIMLYPNPNNGSFSVSCIELIPNTTIEIYSILGTKLFERKIKSNNESFDLKLNSGVYLYTIKTNSKIIKRDKIIIHK